MDISMRGLILMLSVMALNGIAIDNVIKICSLTRKKSTLIVIFDKYYGNNLENVTEALSKQWIPFILMDNKEVISYLQANLPQVLLQENFERIHIVYTFVVLCQQNVTAFLRDVQDIDKNFGLEIVIRHFSTWIFICDDRSFQFLNDTTIDNVVHMPTKQMLGVQTLMWKNDCRKFEKTAFKPPLHLEDVYPNTKLGFNNRTLLIGTLDWPPFMAKINTTGSVDYKGLGREIINHLAAKYNFTCTFVEPEDKHWGDNTGNNTWTGFIAMLQRREVDIGLAYYAYTEERARVIEYSFFFYHDVLKVLYKKPEVDPDRTWKLLVSIFKWQVYLCGAATLVVVLAILVLFEQWSCGSNLSMWRRTLPDILFLGVNVPLRQGSHIILKSGAGLVLLCFWWLFCFIITSVYTGNLIAVTTVEREKVPFSNLEELSENREYEVGLIEGSFFKDILKHSKMKTYKEIWEKVQSNSIDDKQDLITKRKQIKTLINQGKFALFGTHSGIKVVLGTTCGLSEMTGFGIRHSSSLVFPKYSPLARLFSADLQWLFETGWITATEERFRENDIKCIVVDNGAQPLMLDDLLSALVTCVGGVLAAVVVLVIETQLKRNF